MRHYCGVILLDPAVLKGVVPKGRPAKRLNHVLGRLRIPSWANLADCPSRLMSLHPWRARLCCRVERC